jgi:probable HAF family extracellular repeat protein
LFRPYVERVEDRCLLSYVLTDLGTLGGTLSFASGINASGQVVGTANTTGGADHAFLSSGGVMTDLGTLGGTYSYATAINDNGQVVGFSSTHGDAAYHAFLYSGGVMTDLGTLGGTYSVATAINDSGQVIGDSTTPGGTPAGAGDHAFLYGGGVMTDLGTLGGTYSYASGINASGQVVGISHTTVISYTTGGATSHGFLYSGGVMTDLGTLGGTDSFAGAINASVQAVGSSYTTRGADHAFLSSGGVMTDLGTLGGTYSAATAINDNGQVVGTSDITGDAALHGFFYSGGVMRDLNDLIPAGSGVTIEAASAINNQGQIAADGSIGSGHAILLTPGPSSLSGVVFSDFNNDGQVDFGEQGIAGVMIKLDGTDDLGNAVHLSQTTDANGAYVFLDLRPGSYTITEPQEPAGFTQGINSVGTAGGTVSGDTFSVTGLAAGTDGLNYNFGERPAATGAIAKGQTAGIGFWNNKNGQALVKALNGGPTSTQLGDWLAATFPHMFGAQSGSSNLAGKSNADVAALFQSRFVVKDQKLDAQVLATALSVYVTDGTLDDTGVGTQYGFIVGGNGVAAATFNVGGNGDAFGVANNTVMTVLDFLLAADAQAVNGVLYYGNTTKRNMANNVFSAINQAGGI